MKLKFLLPLLFALTALAEDGRVAIRSTPSGVSIYEMTVASSGEKSIKKLHDMTVAGKYILLALPLGEHSLIFEKEFHIGDSKKITVSGKIQKIDVTLKEYLFTVDVVFLEEGFQVYVDRKPYLVDEKPVMAPTTIKVAQGRHEVRLVKKGYNDIIKRVDIDKNQQLIVEGRPRRGLMTVARDIKKSKPTLDLEIITMKQWDKINGIILSVSARKELDTKIKLSGEPIVIIPHPDDRWRAGLLERHISSYKGLNYKNGKFPIMCLCYRLGNKIGKYGLVIGSGKLFLFANDHHFDDNSGHIRVKIIKHQ